MTMEGEEDRANMFQNKRKLSFQRAQNSCCGSSDVSDGSNLEAAGRTSDIDSDGLPDRINCSQALYIKMANHKLTPCAV
jgi:hypothetical protein